MAKTYKGKQIVMDSLVAEGVEYVFGNPGTTELPLVDSLLEYPRLKYILTLQEAATVMMAEWYAHASGKVGVVNLHIAPGLGNGLGMLYNAQRGNTPMVITAGQHDTGFRLRDPILYGDLVAMAAPLTKWAVQAESADELPLIMHRAFQIAREEPLGPVFVSLPMNVMEQETKNPPLPPARLYRCIPPDPAGLAAAVDLLLQARRPAILCGDGVARSRAQDELVAVAEFLGASVWNECFHKSMNFPNTSVHYRERMPAEHIAIRQALRDADAVLMVGGRFFEEIWNTPVAPFPEEAALIQIQPAARRLAENFSVHVGMQADPKAALAALLEGLRAGADEPFRKAAAERCARLATLKVEERKRQDARAQQSWHGVPISTARLMAAVKEALPPDAIVGNETVTGAADLMRTLEFRGPDDYYSNKGGGIGQALPGGIGLKLAHPDRPVIALSGDGSSLYTIQSLWTAAHHRIPVVFVILHNRTYRILKLNMNRYRKDAGIGGERGYPHLDLADPDVGYVKVAEGFGLGARRVTQPDEIVPALREAFASGRPYLVEAVIDGRL